ncbi:hypothetical protein [Haloferula sp. A504]|uniref:hypothetical protein n=1 Tax=Haloferula sp. A504 TaxID=3373601 RepID=UPI0031C2F7D6|nr:hypothetical protein [Verrucomicrobiaceae bacterium E54]
MHRRSHVIHAIRLGIFCLALAVLHAAPAAASEPPDAGLEEFEEALLSSEDAGSVARQRLAVRRVIRDAEKRLEEGKSEATRWSTLEFLFRARQRLVALDDDNQYREDLIETCRELVKAPDEFAELRLEADLLLSQVEQAKRSDGTGDRSAALRRFIDRYVGTPAGPKALRTTMVMALEIGDTRLVNDLRQIIAENYSADLEMITFLRDHLGGQVFGVPFVGHFQRSDGKTACFPMDGLGHSSMVIFWSKEDPRALQYIADLAAAQKVDHERIDGRLELISMNLDDLPDAGESIIRRLGAGWPCLHFPGGRENPMYRAYARVDPLNMRVAPTGQVAMMMRESSPKPTPLTPEELEETLGSIKPSEDLKPQTESFRRTLIRSWSRDDYAQHLSALMTGDFLIFDPEGALDPTRPPELKAAAMGGKVTPLERGAGSVPEETLVAIQDCLIAPPQRYHSSVAEIRAGYRKMHDLCRKALKDYPDAPDLWIVRNRLMIALLGLWKTDFDPAFFEAAVAEAQLAMAAGYPEGTDVIPRFCLTRQALRNPDADPGKVIDAFVAGQGGASAPGPVLAVAALLSLDVADEARYERFRSVILAGHTEYPSMWLFSSFLLSRYHDYWMFHVPFTAGWSFGRRLKNEMTKGSIEEARRMLKLELATSDGKTFRIPEDLEADYTAILLAQPGTWRGNDREDTRPPSPSRILRNFPGYALQRPDVDLRVAMLGKADEQAVLEDIKVRNSETQWDHPILEIPGGMNNPLVHRLGMLDDEACAVLVDKQGRILTNLTSEVGNVSSVFPDTIHLLDEQFVMEALKRGDIEAAEQRIMSLAPPYDPEAVDEKGRKLPEPKYSLPHLRARARVYMALQEWEKALADAEVVFQAELGKAGGMSLRTKELDEAEALRDSIKEEMNSR